MDVKELEEAYKAIEMLKELNLPVSFEQLQDKMILESRYLSENVVPKIQSQIQAIVGNLHKSFCLVVEYKYGTPVQVRIVERDGNNYNSHQSTISKKRHSTNYFSSAHILNEWKKILKRFPDGNIVYKEKIRQPFNTISKLLKIMQSKENLKYTSSLFGILNLPTAGDVTPRVILNILEPEQLIKVSTKEGFSNRIVLWSRSQKVELLKDGTRVKLFHSDGVTPVMIDKTKEIKEGQWTLKTLCDLFAQKEYFAYLHTLKQNH